MSWRSNLGLMPLLEKGVLNWSATSRDTGQLDTWGVSGEGACLRGMWGAAVYAYTLFY